MIPENANFGKVSADLAVLLLPPAPRAHYLVFPSPPTARPGTGQCPPPWPGTMRPLPAQIRLGSKGLSLVVQNFTQCVRSLSRPGGQYPQLSGGKVTLLERAAIRSEPNLVIRLSTLSLAPAIPFAVSSTLFGLILLTKWHPPLHWGNFAGNLQFCPGFYLLARCISLAAEVISLLHRPALHSFRLH